MLASLGAKEIEYLEDVTSSRQSETAVVVRTAIFARVVVQSLAAYGWRRCEW